MVEPVLDLTNRAVRRRLGLGIADITSDDEEGVERCRTVADLARAEGYRAIRSPSAARRGGGVLAIYLESAPENLRMHVGGERRQL